MRFRTLYLGFVIPVYIQFGRWRVPTALEHESSGFFFQNALDRLSAQTPVSTHSSAACGLDAALCPGSSGLTRRPPARPTIQSRDDIFACIVQELERVSKVVSLSREREREREFPVSHDRRRGSRRVSWKRNALARSRALEIAHSREPRTAFLTDRLSKTNVFSTISQIEALQRDGSLGAGDAGASAERGAAAGAQAGLVAVGARRTRPGDAFYAVAAARTLGLRDPRDRYSRFAFRSLRKTPVRFKHI